jgi:carboxyl-terminal processing protease
MTNLDLEPHEPNLARPAAVDRPDEETDRTADRPQRGSAIWNVAFVASIVLFVAVAGFGAGILAERELFSEVGSGDGPTLGEIEELLEAEAYFWPEDPAAQDQKREELEQAALKGAAAVLDTEDPYTGYLPPAETEDAAHALSGQYEGIGVYIEPTEAGLTIVSPMFGSPAAEAGLRSGDILLAADDQPLADLTAEEAGQYVRGPEGTTVKLTIQRPGDPEPFVVELTRRKIDVPVVQYGFDAETGVAVIKVMVFGDKTTEQLDAALERAIADGAVALVLDLRDNGGGYVSAAQEMIGRFVPPERGPALYEDDDRREGNDLLSEPIVAGDLTVYDLPMVVLVNGGTASASEIVAGALRDYDRATVVGEPTFGKGSVQRVHNFPDGSSVRVTFAIWLTPDQQPIEGAGIAPLVAIPPPAGPIESDPELRIALAEDSQLRGAIEVALTVTSGAPIGVQGTPAASPAASPVATPVGTPAATPAID